MKYKVLLYYKYSPLSDPEAIRQSQYDFCQKHNLKGRILISDEGLNGTVSGLVSDIRAYQKFVEQQEEFAGIEWKESEADEHVFPKLKVKVRDEVVTLGLKKAGQDVDLDKKAPYIEPEELLQLYESDEDFVILDARNEYEAKIGKFKDALVPPIDNFRDFPKFVEKNLKNYKDKPVVTYCTGGIRCEKASAYLRQKGFKNVRQLHGGVHVYSERTGGKYFQGDLFVFDKRLQMKVNHVNPEVITECEHCQKKISRYIDCEPRLDNCTGLFICCPDCQDKYKSACPRCYWRN